MGDLGEGEEEEEEEELVWGWETSWGVWSSLMSQWVELQEREKMRVNWLPCQAQISRNTRVILTKFKG